jgi:hypothetical protein
MVAADVVDDDDAVEKTLCLFQNVVTADAVRLRSIAIICPFVLRPVIAATNNHVTLCRPFQTDVD